MTVHQLSRADARRVAVRAQLLDAARPVTLLDVVRRLTLLQVDPVAVIAPNADLVAWSRLGASYAPADLAAALAGRTLLELRAMIRPAADLALYRADMAAWDDGLDRQGWRKSQLDWVRANDACRRDILARLAESGPLPSRDLPDTCRVPWSSTGWTNNRNVTQLLEFMVRRGEVAVAGRKGRERLWDRAARVYPDDPPVVPRGRCPGRAAAARPGCAAPRPRGRPDRPGRRGRPGPTAARGPSARRPRPRPAAP